jgi:hypothetical protein
VVAGRVELQVRRAVGYADISGRRDISYMYCALDALRCEASDVSDISRDKGFCGVEIRNRGIRCLIGIAKYTCGDHGLLLAS